MLKHSIVVSMNLNSNIAVIFSENSSLFWFVTKFEHFFPYSHNNFFVIGLIFPSFQQNKKKFLFKKNRIYKKWFGFEKNQEKSKECVLFYWISYSMHFEAVISSLFLCACNNRFYHKISQGSEKLRTIVVLYVRTRM